MHKRKTYVGIDMTTESVGWAVTDQDYNLIRARGKNLHGARLFSKAELAKPRRLNRSGRRRINRMQARIHIIRDYFADEIHKNDTGFYTRLDESKFHIDERCEENKQKNSIFSDADYTDKDYFAEYPTIFHLRSALIHNMVPFDSRYARKVYLAISNMFKHRGNFYTNGISSEDEGGSFAELYGLYAEDAIGKDFNLPPVLKTDVDAMEGILGDRKLSRTAKGEAVAALLGVQKKDKRTMALLKLICGLSVALKDAFPEDVDLDNEEQKKFSLSFQDGNIEEKIDGAEGIISPENFDLLMAAKTVHDKGLLSSIMRGHTYLSDARVEAYEQHKQDLVILKAVLRRYGSKKNDLYNNMFRTMDEGNYSSYIGSVNSHGCVIRRTNNMKSDAKTQKALHDTIKKLFAKLPEAAKSDPDVEYIRSSMETGTFLAKQLVSTNGIIPNQIHTRELKAILSNAERNLPFLKTVDESGLTVSERIVSLFTFRIPYYVGPLGCDGRGNRGKNTWAEHLEPGRVLPWNMAEKINLEKASLDFIERAVRRCSYLSGNPTLPKYSLLYQRFEVLNELNGVRIRGEALPVELKQDLYNELFKYGKRVSLTDLKNFLHRNGYGVVHTADISGLEQNGFSKSLSSIGRFLKILGERALYDENKRMIEDIIYWSTIFGDDKTLIREKIENKYRDRISSEEIRRALGYNFKDWGSISREFLDMEGCSKSDGEIRSVIGSLWYTENTLEELMSGRYTYKESLAKMVSLAEKPLREWSFDDLDGMYLSAPVRRMIWQALVVLKELEEVLDDAPSCIFINARSDSGSPKKLPNRKDDLIKLYKALGKKSEYTAWSKELEDRPESDYNIRKLYLYYMQLGRCMLTGNRIELDELMKRDSECKYNIHHIYPKHFVRDNSMDNLVLVEKDANKELGDTYPVAPKVQTEMKEFWGMLLDKKFISKEKYDRLTCTKKLSDEQKADFIARHLGEPGYTAKVVKDILRQVFPRTEIIYAKSDNVADFRQKFGIPHVTCANDFYCAQDAYLNIIVGNVYHTKFTDDPLWFIKQGKKYPKDPLYKYNMDKMFTWDIVRDGRVAWTPQNNNKTGTIGVAKKILGLSSPLVTRQTREEHGSIFGQMTIWSADSAGKGKGYAPVKMSEPRLGDVARYGGYTNISGAGYSLIEYTEKGKVCRSLEFLPVYLGKVEDISVEKLVEFYKERLNEEKKDKPVTDVRICRKFIPQYSLIRYNGFEYYLCGRSGGKVELKGAVQTFYNQKYLGYIKKLEKAVTSTRYDEVDKYGKPVLSKEFNMELLQYLADKHRNTSYGKRRGAVPGIITNCSEAFSKLALKDQCNVLFEFVKYLNFSSKCPGIDLTLLGASSQTGKISISKQIIGAEEFTLITQSPTGLFRNEIDLLG